MTEIQDAIAKAAALAAETRAKTERAYLKAATQGVATIASFDIKETKNDGPAAFIDLRVDTSDPRFPGVPVDEVGAIRSNPIFLNKFDGAGYKDMVKFVNCALDLKTTPSKEEFAEALNDMRSSEQSIRGVKVRYEVSPVKISKSGKAYSTVKFFPIPGQTAEDVAKNRATLPELKKQA